MSEYMRVELVWFDCFDDDHLECFTFPRKDIDDAIIDAMAAISDMPTYMGFRTLSLFSTTLDISPFG